MNSPEPQLAVLPGHKQPFASVTFSLLVGLLAALAE
jgi:hypothetical protein